MHRFISQTTEILSMKFARRFGRFERGGWASTRRRHLQPPQLAAAQSVATKKCQFWSPTSGQGQGNRQEPRDLYNIVCSSSSLTGFDRFNCSIFCWISIKMISRCPTDLKRSIGIAFNEDNCSRAEALNGGQVAAEMLTDTIKCQRRVE